MNTFNNGEISTFRTRQHLVSGFVCFPLSFQEACFGSRVTCIVHGVIFASPSSSLCHPLSNRKLVDQTPSPFHARHDRPGCFYLLPSGESLPVLLLLLFSSILFPLLHHARHANFFVFASFLLIFQLCFESGQEVRCLFMKQTKRVKAGGVFLYLSWME